MKRLSILIFALTAISAAGGYGAGLAFRPDPAADAPVVADADPAAPVTDAVDQAIAQVDDEASDEATDPDDDLVKLGRITVPVYKSRSVTYIVADFGVLVSDAAQAKSYRKAENSARLRDSILASMHEAARVSQFADPAQAQANLSEQIQISLVKKFDGIEEVRFLAFYQGDVPLI